MRNLFRRIDQIINWISTVFLWISAVAIFLMAFVSFCDVFCRYFLNSPIKGGQEIVELSMAVFVFFGMGMAARRCRLTRVPLFLDMMGPALKSFFQAGGSIICCIASGLFCRQLMLSAIRYFSKTSVQSPTLGIPYWPFYLLASIGCGLMALEMLARFVKEIAAGCAALQQRKNSDEEVAEE